LRILSIDPGDKRIGVAVSDSGGRLARPLTVLEHTSRERDAQAVAALAASHQAEMILVGYPGEAGEPPGPQARKVLRFVEALRRNTPVTIQLWDESLTTVEAQSYREKARRREALDAVAAAILLQSFLEATARTASDE